MGNLIGQNPREWVKTQVDLRQQLLGLENRDPEVLSWATNNTAWIRAISAVDITTPEKSVELTGSPNYQGNRLAKSFILQNGVSKLDSNGTLTQLSGVYGGGDMFGNSYGFAGIDQGLVPPPGIESLDIKTYNRGSFRKATLKLKVNSKKQFSIIEALFMHPGFTLLIEWGHTRYYTHTNSEGKNDIAYKQLITSPNLNTIPFKLITADNGIDQDTVLAGIKREQQASCGNYDGFFGKIVNFRWTFNIDSSYDISIDAISIGDVIESLTINRIATVKPPFPEEEKNKYTNATPEKTETQIKNENIAEQQKFLNRLSGVKLSAGSLNGLVTGADIINNTQAWKDVYATLQESYAKYARDAISSAGYEFSSNGFTKKPVVTSTVTLTDEPALDTSLISNANKSTLHKYLYDLYNKLNKASKGKEVKEIETYEFCNSEEQSKSKTKIPKIKVYSAPASPNASDDKELLVLKPSRRARKTTSYSNGASNETNVTVASNNSPYQYVKLYNILRYIEENLLIYSVDPEGKPIPLVKFDTNYSNTFCFTYPGQFSTDPSVCVIPFTTTNYYYDPKSGKSENNYLVESQVYKIFEKVLSSSNDSLNFKISGEDYAARLMYIHVNVHFVATCLDNATNENGVVLLKFLEQILNGIQGALGNVNKLVVTYDHDDNTIKFMDDIPLSEKVIKLVDPTNFDKSRKTVFNVYGWRPGKSTQFDPNAYSDVTGKSIGYGNVQNGTFVSDVKLDSGLTPQFATMLAIGAQARGDNSIANATAFVKFHTGLQDRIISNKLSKSQVTAAIDQKETMTKKEIEELEALKKSKTPNQARYQALLDKYNRIYGDKRSPLEQYADNLKILYGTNGLVEQFYQRGITVSSDVLNISTNISTEVSKYTVSLLNTDADVPSATGFIPFDLGITFLGMSGIRLYERFFIDQNILPESYNRDLSFIIKGVDHKVDSKGWETSISSIAAANNSDSKSSNKGVSLSRNATAPIETPPLSENN